jgi:stage II sporulation protein D
MLGMKYLGCALTLLALAFDSGCSAEMRPQPLRVPAASVPRFVRVKISANAAPVRVPLEEYVRGTILSEFAPPSGDPADIERMLEVQAVIARTYAVAHVGRHQRDGYDLCSTTHCQLYQPGRLKTSSWARLAKEAADSTAAQILWFGKGPASALFHADCGGHTSDATDIWGGTARPYLLGVADGGAAESAHVSWRYEVERNDLIAALNADPRTRVGTQLRDISVTRRDDGGRALLVVLNGSRDPVVRGEELRTVLGRAFGAKSIRSTRFQISRSGQRFVFTGQGYGHGVGLCQAGAYARLKAGARPEQVLARYYPGTRLIVTR